MSEREGGKGRAGGWVGGKRGGGRKEGREREERGAWEEGQGHISGCDPRWGRGVVARLPRRRRRPGDSVGAAARTMRCMRRVKDPCQGGGEAGERAKGTGVGCGCFRQRGGGRGL